MIEAPLMLTKSIRLTATEAIRNDRANQPVLSAYVTSADGAAAAHRIAAALYAAGRVTVKQGGFRTAARLLGTDHLGTVILVEWPDTPRTEDLATVQELSSAATVIGIGAAIGIDAFRGLMAAGLTDYRALPLSDSEDLSLFAALKDRQAAAPPSATNTGRITAVVSASGGAGGSMTAANLAWALATRHGRRVALVDADVQNGSVFIDFNCAPTVGFLDALAAPDRVDSTFLNATMAQPTDRLFLYSAETVHSDGAADFMGFAPLLDRMRQEFDDIVIDLPRHLFAADPALLALLNKVVVVTSPGYAALRSRERLLGWLKAASSRAEVVNVLSLNRPDAQLSPAEIRKNLGIELAAILPLATGGVSRAAVAGLPLVASEPKSAFGRAIIAFAADMNGQSPRSRGFLRRVLGL